MIKLAPSILSADFARLLEDVKKVENAGCEYLHIDVMDGHFVPNITLGPNVVKSLRKDVDMVFDAHLMIENPDQYIKEFVDAGCDIIVGFPGETEEDFEDTLDVVSKVHFEQVYMFIYSRRVGTPADKMENQVPDEVKHERFDRLKKLAESQIAGNNQKYVNTIQKVLVEGKSKTNENMLTGRTDTNKVVNFEGTEDMIGKIVNLKIVSEHMWYLKGEVQ